MKRWSSICKPASFFLLMLFVSINLSMTSAEELSSSSFSFLDDACAIIHNRESANGGDDDKPHLIIDIAAVSSSSSGGTTGVHFTNCTIPHDLDITIAIEPPSQQEEDRSSNSAVMIEIFNTTMQGGSLHIVPKAGTMLQNVFITARRSVLEGTGDVLLVTAPSSPTTSPTPGQSTPTTSVLEEVKNLTIQVEDDVILSSKEGSVASIDSRGVVEDTSILVDGNSTIQAKFLAASIQTANLVRSTLIINTRQRSSMVNMSAGGDSVSGHVGILSVFSPLSSLSLPRVSVHVEDVRIAVIETGDGGGGVHLVATGFRGATAIAGVVVRHGEHADLTMSGHVHIGMAFLSGGTEGKQQNSSISATINDHDSAVTVGGVAVLTSDAHTSSQASIAMDECTLSISFEGDRSRILRMSPQITSDCATTAATHLSVSSKGGGIASAILGVALYTYSTKFNSGSFFTVVNSSTVTITSNMEGTAETTMVATSDNSNIASTVLGVAIFSRCSTLDKSVKSDTHFVVQDSSSMRFLFSAVESGQMALQNVVRQSQNWMAASILGVAIVVHTHSVNSASSSAFSVSNGSTFSIASNAAHSSRVSMRLSCGNGAAATILGTSIYVYTHGSSTASTLFAVVERSKFVCSTIVTDATKFSVRLHNARNVANSFAGVALLSLASTTASTTLTVTRSSSLAIQSSTSGSSDVEMALSSSGAIHLASSILGVATIAHSSESSGTTVSTIDVHDGSVLTITSSSTGSGTVQLKSQHASSHSASTVLGVAMYIFSRNTKNTVAVSSQHGSNVTIAHSVVMIGNGFVDLLVSSTTHSAALSVLGVAMKQQVHSKTATQNSIRMRNSSRLDIAATTSGNVSAVATASSTHGEYIACAVFGVAMYSYPGKPMLSVGSSSSLHIKVGLNDTSRVMASSPKAASVTAVLGIALSGQGKPQLAIVAETVDDDAPPMNSPSSSYQPNVEVWVGALHQSIMEVAPTGSHSSVAVGLLSGQFQGLTEDNTELSFCSDGTSHPKASSPAVTLRTKPDLRAAGVAFNTTALWRPNSAPNATTEWCSTKATTLETFVNDAVVIPSYERGDTVVSPTSTLESTASASLWASVSANLSTTLTTATPKTSTVSTSVSRTIIVDPAPTNSTTPAPTTAPRKRTTKVTASVMLPNNEAAATVVLSTAGASGAVASTMGTGGGGMVVTAGSSVRLMECGMSDDDDPAPASFEMPIQFAIGNGRTKYFAGSSLAHALLLWFFFALPVLLRSRLKSTTKSRALRRIVSHLSILFCGAYAFFTPAILGACSTVLNNDNDALGLSVACGSTLAIIVLHLAVVTAVHRGPQNGLVARVARDGRKEKLQFSVVRTSATTSTSSTTTSSSSSSSDSEEEVSAATTSTSSDSNSSWNDSSSSSSWKSSQYYSTAFLFSGRATKDILLTLFDGCRLYDNAAHRHYASIETTINSLIAIISGARPQEHCNAATFVTGALAAVQLLYVLLVRPFRTRLDMIFSFVNAMVLVILSMVVAISVQNRQDKSEYEPPEEWALKAVEVCLWLISVLGYVQLVVQGYWAFHVEQRRKHHLQQQENEERQSATSSNSDVDGRSSDDDHHPLGQPLLIMAEGGENEEEEMLQHLGVSSGVSTTSSISSEKRLANPLH